MRVHSAKWETNFWDTLESKSLKALQSLLDKCLLEMMRQKKKNPKKQILASPAIQPPKGPEDYLDSCLWVPSSSDKSDYVHRPQPSTHYQEELFSLTGFHMCPSNSVFEISLIFHVCSPLTPLVSLCFFVLLVSASYPHFDSQSFRSTPACRITAQWDKR